MSLRLDKVCELMRRELSLVDRVARLGAQGVDDPFELGLVGGHAQVPVAVGIGQLEGVDPEELVDEAFLRRIPYKINVPSPREDERTSARSWGLRRP